jgi:hypothetical protein
MPYTYSRIYNVTKGLWAYDVAGQNDPKKVWADNEWEENDALVGFSTKPDSTDFYFNVIYCHPGYLVYVQAEHSKTRTDFALNDNKYRVPPAILVNLQDTSDTKMLCHKSNPTLMKSDDDSSVSSSESDASSDSDDVEILCADNKHIVKMLQTRYDNETNQYKQNAYHVAINDVCQTNYPITIKMLNNNHRYSPCRYWNMGEKMRERIANFLLGCD